MDRESVSEHQMKQGTQSTLTLSARKRRRREIIRKYRQTQVALSQSFEAWKALKDRGDWTHGELAAHLLDVHRRHCTRPNCKPKTGVPEDDSESPKSTEIKHRHGGETAHQASFSTPNQEEEMHTLPSAVSKIRKSRTSEDSVDEEFLPLDDNQDNKFKLSVKAPLANGSVYGKKYVTILPKPVRNQNGMSKSGNNASSVLEEITETINNHDHEEKECNQTDVSESESDAASLSVHTVVGCQDEIISKDTEKRHDQQPQEAKVREEEDEDLDITQSEVELKEPTVVEDFLTFGENLEPDETDLNDKSGSDNEGLENDSDFGEPNIEVIFDDDGDGYSSEEGENLKEKRQRLNHQVTDLPFKRFDLAEVAKAEGVSDSGSSRNRIRKLYWTELERAYQCRMCTFEESSAYSTCRHLLQEHPEIVGDLEEYLKGKPALDSEPCSTLYDIVMEAPPPNDSIAESESCDGIGEEMGSAAISDGGSKFSGSGGRETKEHPLDSMESVELLSRWVKLQLSCQFCQKVVSCHLFTQNGKRIIHRCRLGNCNSSLCDVCGKSFVNFRQHWLSTHSKPELRICPYCGEMKTAWKLSLHIIRCHTNKKDEYHCGVCKKGFKTKKSRNAHDIIHQKDKPFKCIYCQRGFSQSSNMKHHMRQHTGEKPYECNKCSESFAHNVSLKNHLKSKHGIDPWNIGTAGD